MTAKHRHEQRELLVGFLVPGGLHLCATMRSRGVYTDRVFVSTGSVTELRSFLALLILPLIQKVSNQQNLTFQFTDDKRRPFALMCVARTNSDNKFAQRCSD